MLCLRCISSQGSICWVAHRSYYTVVKRWRNSIRELANIVFQLQFRKKQYDIKFILGVVGGYYYAKPLISAYLYHLPATTYVETVCLMSRKWCPKSLENTEFYKMKVNLSTRSKPLIYVYGNISRVFFVVKMSLKLGRVELTE